MTYIRFNALCQEIYLHFAVSDLATAFAASDKKNPSITGDDEAIHLAELRGPFMTEIPKPTLGKSKSSSSSKVKKTDMEVQDKEVESEPVK